MPPVNISGTRNGLNPPCRESGLALNEDWCDDYSFSQRAKRLEQCLLELGQ